MTNEGARDRNLSRIEKDIKLAKGEKMAREADKSFRDKKHEQPEEDGCGN